jgi:hypothetical protein
MPVCVPDSLVVVVVVFVIGWRQSLGRCVARIPEYLLYSGCVRVPGNSSFAHTNLGVRQHLEHLSARTWYGEKSYRLAPERSAENLGH